MNILDKICADKLLHVAAQKAKISENLLLEQIKQQTIPHESLGGEMSGFLANLQKRVISPINQIGLIAEIKKASPSKGIIRADFNPTILAQNYESGGATCLSILTDVPYFQGADEYLSAVKQATRLPCLRKDFMVDNYQIIESRALGADAILIIMAALEIKQAQEFAQTAKELGMDVLVEIHDEAELNNALEYLHPQLLGINNRNLKTFAISLETTEKLVPKIPDDILIVCESGIYSNADILRMQKIGVNCFLVGESLMRQADVTQATKELLGIAE